MTMSTVMSEEMREVMARALAKDIRARRNGLDNEDRLADGAHPTYARAKKYRDQDRARVHGMTIALTYLLGSPLVIERAEQFIAICHI